MSNLLRKFGGKLFRQVAKAKTKGPAKKRAGGIRNRGGSARVVKAKKGFSIFRRGGGKGKGKKRR